MWCTSLRHIAVYSEGTGTLTEKIKKVKKLLEKEIDNIQTNSTCVQMHTLKILIIKMSRKNNVVRTRNKSSICGKIRGDDQEENVEYKM